MANRSDDTDDVPGGYEDDMFSQRDRYASQDRRARPHAVSDFLRRAIDNTVGSVQNTGSLSKEALSFLLQQGDRGKREVVRIVANEVSSFLRGIDLSGEIVKVLTSVQLEVSASVRFKPTGDGGVRPEIRDADLEVSPSDEVSGEAPPASVASDPARPARESSSAGRDDEE